MSLTISDKQRKNIMAKCQRYTDPEKMNRKCIVILCNDSNYYNNERTNIYGSKIFENPIAAAINVLTDCARAVRGFSNPEIEYWANDILNNPIFEYGHDFLIDSNLDGLRLQDAQNITTREIILLKKLGIYLCPLFTVGYGFCGARNDCGLWAIIDVETIMPSFETKWTLMYNAIAKHLLDSPKTSALGKDVLQIILDYLGEWIPCIAGYFDYFNNPADLKKVEKINLNARQNKESEISDNILQPFPPLEDCEEDSIGLCDVSGKRKFIE